MKKLALLVALGALSAPGWATVGEVADVDIGVGDSIVWSAGDTILLTEKVIVDSGAVLVIEPGVVVKGAELSEGEGGPSALIIARHARIRAEGTQEEPIVFTAERDDLDSSTFSGQNLRLFGLWGGIAVLGDAGINREAGVATYDPFGYQDQRLAFGGTNDEDNSGTLAWISIRFAGQNEFVPEEPNDQRDDYREPAALALCAVGSQTEVHHIEVYNCLDDAFRFLGGTVNCRYLAANYPLDNAFDTDEGYRGHCQFLWAAMRNEPDKEGTNFGLHHGSYEYPWQGLPYSLPVFANVTYAGDGSINYIVAEMNTGVKYYNSIFWHGFGFDFEPNTWSRIDSGDLEFRKNIVGRQVAQELVWADFAGGWKTEEHLAADNVIGHPQLVSFSSTYIRDPMDRMDPRPRSDLIDTDVMCLADAIDTVFIKQACYKGAFDPREPVWLLGWTGIDKYGFLDRDNTPPRESIDTCCEPVTVQTVASAGRTGMARIVSRPGVLEISHDAHNAALVSVHLYTLSGQMVSNPMTRVVPAGSQTHVLSLRGLRPGTYVCRVAIGEKETRALVPVR